MSLTIPHSVAASSATHIANIVRSGLFENKQREAFFNWLDGLIQGGNTPDSRLGKAKHVVSTAPFDDSSVIKRHPRLFDDFKYYAKDKSAPELARDVIDTITDSTTVRFSRDERVQFLDAIINLVGYDVISKDYMDQVASRDKVALLLRQSFGLDDSHEYHF